MPKMQKSTSTKNIPLKGKKRHFDMVLADKLIYEVVNQAVHPICNAEAASHAVASSLAKLAAQVMFDKVNYIRESVNACAQDLLDETDYTYPKLKEHIDLLLVSKILIAEVLDEKAVELEQLQVTDRITDNILNKIFCLLPGGTNVIDNHLHKIYDLLKKKLEAQVDGLDEIETQIQQETDENIRTNMRGLYYPHFSDLIEPLLQNQLNDLTKNTDSAVRAVAKIRNKMALDWQADIGQLHSKKWGCPPFQPRKQPT